MSWGISICASPYNVPFGFKRNGAELYIVSDSFEQDCISEVRNRIWGPSMIKSAHEVRQVSRSKNAINDEVKEILGAMQAQILVANKEGRNNIDFPVPKYYVAFPNDKDAELTIIATVLRELLAGDYKVEIRNIDHSLLFDIRWISDLTPTDRKKMELLLSEHMVRNDGPSEQDPRARQSVRNIRDRDSASQAGYSGRGYSRVTVPAKEEGDEDDDGQ